MQDSHYDTGSTMALPTHDEVTHSASRKIANLDSYSTSCADYANSSLQYYYNAYAWPQNLGSGGGGGGGGGAGNHHGEAGGANMLLQYASTHGGPFYPHPGMYPSVITASFGADLSGEVGNGANTIGFDPSILELRKEKSRDAARSRRGKENYEFYELAKMLPLPGAITSQLDKASIIRLTISFLKLRDFSGHGDPPWQRDMAGVTKGGKGSSSSSRRRNNVMNPTLAVDIFEAHQGTHILQSLDGFVFALSNDGRFLYISETVSIYLGLSQVEMTGSSVFDYVHTSDHQEMAEQLGLNSQGIYSSTSSSGGSEEGGTSNSNPSRAVTPTLPERTSIMNPNPSKGYDRCFCVRMKSTLTKRGVHVKSSGYRVVQILSHMRPQFSFSLTRKHPPPLLGLVAMAIALPPPTMTELVIDNDMFITRLSPELKVTYCEARIADMMDISADDLTNKNLYDYCHAEDLQKLRRAHIDLLGKGQVLTDYYRLMNKHGGYVWIQTCATIICNAKNADEQNIIAINYVLSGVEYAGCVMNTNQLKVVSKTEPDQSDHSENEQGLEREEKRGKEEKMPSRRDRQNGDDRGHRGNKRKHAAAQDNRSTLSEMTTAEQHSPMNSFDLLYQKHKNLAKETEPGINGVVLHTDSINSLDKHNKSIDMKNSRRKMEKPRKRKRDLNDPDPDGKVDLSLSAVDGNNDFDLPTTINPADVGALTSPDSSVLGPGHGLASRPASSHSTVNPTSPVLSTSDHGARGSCRMSPTPEDLSMRNSQSPLVAMSPKPRSITPVIEHTVPLDNTAGTAQAGTATEAALRHAWAADPTVAPQPEPGLAEIATSCGNSVRDLEEAMNKHLPSLPGETDHIRASLAAAADYSQSMLGLHQKHKSTIQWIGSQGHATSEGTLPATNLLRSLYVNRESVIRTNIYNPRPQYYGSDMQNSLLTPPGGTSDPYKETFTSPTHNESKTSPSSSTNYPGLISSYSTSPISVTMATTNMTDAYAMTPPSSVSPQEKYASPYADQFHGEMGMSALRGYGAHDGSLTMPIKPQAYPLPAHANAHVANYDRSTQYSTPPGYYGTTFAPYNHTASPSPAHYRDTRASNVW